MMMLIGIWITWRSCRSWNDRRQGRNDHVCMRLLSPVHWAFIIWYLFMRYYRRDAKRMNDQIQEITQFDLLSGKESGNRLFSFSKNTGRSAAIGDFERWIIEKKKSVDAILEMQRGENPKWKKWANVYMIRFISCYIII